jgi:hypothetical protein
MTATRVPTPDLACIEPATAVGNAPVECLTLPATDLGHHVVLRSFDVLRQRISSVCAGPRAASRGTPGWSWARSRTTRTRGSPA